LADSPGFAGGPGESAGAPGQEGELERLRRLLVAVEQGRLAEIERRLDDPETRADELSRVLPESLARAAHHGNRLSLALSPAVEEALGVSIRRNRRHLAEALSPAMGPAIRRAIAETLRAMVDSFNQVLQHSLSPRALRWHWEAWRTGRPFAEVVLSHSLVFRVEQVFLVYRQSGLLLQHVSADPAAAQDGDLVSGMLTAIQDFVRDSFSVAAEEAVDTMRVGDLVVWVEQGQEAYLAAVIRGTPPVGLRAVLRDALETIHLELAEAFEGYAGDTVAFEPARHHLEGCLQMQVQGSRARRSWLAPALAGGVVALLAVAWALASWRAAQRWNVYLARLAAEPGIVVVREHGGIRRSSIAGLRDPDAADPAALLPGCRLDPASVTGTWAPYLSDDPAIVLARARATLQPPPGVTLAFASGALSAAGAAPHSWLVDARQRATAVPGVRRLDTAALADRDLAVVDGVRRRLEAVVLRFDPGSAELPSREDTAFQGAVSALHELEEFAPSAGFALRVDVVGHTDLTGSERTNVRLSRARAEWVLSALEAAGITELPLDTLGVGTRQPVRSEASEEDRANNRSVTFRVLVER
jgi:outer membrane protein OmpA-like peptidoglycan-associated protein